MAKQLYLYSGFTPNLGQGEHLLVNNMAGLVSAMAAYLRQTVTLDSYRINGGIAQVKPANNAMANYLTMSYAIEYDTAGHYGRAYFIRSAQPRADWIDYELDLDHWGTYMHQASIQDLVIRRTNRNIGTGIYDKIEVAGDQTVDIYPNTNSITAGEFAIVFSCEENIKLNKLSLLTEQTTTRQKVYYSGWPANTYEFPRIMAGIERVQNTFQREIATDWNPEIRVIQAWIIPATYLRGGSTVSLKYMDQTGAEAQYSAVEASPAKFSYEITLSTDPDYEYYAGTSKHGVQIPTLTTQQKVVYEFITKIDGMQVLLRNGNNVEDITDAFAINLTINEGQVTGLQAVTNALTTLGTGAGVAMAAAGAVAPGVGIMAGLTMLGSAASQAQRLSSKPQTRHIPGGDGVITIMNETGSSIYLQYPYRITKYQSAANEKAHARLKGAVFNIPYSSLANLKTAALLGTGSASDDTYIEADCDVMNIQSDAAQVIKEKLHSGIYLWDQT